MDIKKILMSLCFLMCISNVLHNIDYSTKNVVELIKNDEVAFIQMPKTVNLEVRPRVNRSIAHQTKSLLKIAGGMARVIGKTFFVLLTPIFSVPVLTTRFFNKDGHKKRNRQLKALTCILGTALCVVSPIMCSIQAIVLPHILTQSITSSYCAPEEDIYDSRCKYKSWKPLATVITWLALRGIALQAFGSIATVYHSWSQKVLIFTVD